MRNVEDPAAAEPPPDDGAGGIYVSAGPRRARRRKQVIASGVGVAAFVGAGAFLMTLHPADDDPATVTNVGAPGAVQRAEPIDPPGASAAAPTAAPSTTTSAAGTSAVLDPPSRRAPTPSLPAEVAKRLAAAREASAKYGVPVMRPVPQATADVADVKVTETGSLKDDKQTLRVVSGRGDLTGHRELAWVADRGNRVRDASCSQTFRLAAEAKPERKPNLLVCWRTSATKSVYTIAVDLDGDPSETTSVAAIAAEWKKLG